MRLITVEIGRSSSFDCFFLWLLSLSVPIHFFLFHRLQRHCKEGKAYCILSFHFSGWDTDVPVGLGRTKVRKLLNGSSVRSFAGLLDRYARNDEASRPKLLSDLLSDGRTNVDLSESVYRLFCARDYGDGRFKPRKSVVSRGQDSVKSSVPSSTPSREHSAGRSGSMEIARTDAQQRSSRLTETSERSIPPLPPPQTMRSFPQSPHERCEDLPAAPVGEVSDVETRNTSVREKTTAGSRLHSWREQPGNGTATTVGSVLQSYSFTTDAASRAPIILD